MKFALKFISVLLLTFTLLIAALATYILVDFTPAAPANQDERVVNDVTQLNPISVSKVIRPVTSAEIIAAIAQTTGPVSIGGGRNSQGGQTAYPDSLHINMRDFNKVINLNVEEKWVTVQAGIRWRDLQEIIDKHDLSVKIMQTYANFTVGGSLSVNVHGRYIGEGPMIRSIRSFKIVVADGSEILVDRNSHPDLYFGAIGGYGSLGVITEVTLWLESNTKVRRQTQDMLVSEYPVFFSSEIRDNDQVVFHNADLFPPAYSSVRSVSWLQTTDDLTVDDRLISSNAEYWWQPKVAAFVAESTFGKWLRQHVLEPVLYSFDAVQWRNYEASYDIRELEPTSRERFTYALREYFVPVDRFADFIPKMRAIFQKSDANIINVSIRHALPDCGSMLAWAPEEVFAFVVYYRQGTDAQSRADVAKWSGEMIDATLSVGGRYYLPYQLHASRAQFEQAYPGVSKLREVKKKYDPESRFTNLFVEKYVVSSSLQ